jgi:hypothetical protein
MIAAESSSYSSHVQESAPGREIPSIYRQYFTPAERRLIDSTPLSSALSEISLIRIMLLRIFGAAHRLRQITLEQRLAMLQAFSHAGLVLASLARYHHRRFMPSRCLLDALDELDPDDI